VKTLEAPARRPTAAEAEAMWRAWSQNGDMRSRDRLIASCIPMVTHIASCKIRELPSHFELEDLVSCGLLALVQTVDRFDPAKGATFEQFAWTRVSGAMVDELRRHDPATRAARRIGRKVARIRQEFEIGKGRQPTEQELADALEIDVTELRSRLTEIDRSDVLSLNAVVPNGDDSTAIELGDTVESPSVETQPELALLNSEKASIVRRAIAALSDREREVLRLLHVEHLKAVEVGELLGVSESRISQILSAIRGKLQAALVEQGLAA
jgi:RNA polymerase sigma factor for flagellar operon FliA